MFYGRFSRKKVEFDYFIDSAALKNQEKINHLINRNLKNKNDYKMKNFIKITEVQFAQSSGKASLYPDYIKPSEIVLMEIIPKGSKEYTKVHFAIGSSKCDILAKETPEEIDELINNLYEEKRKKK